MGPPATPDGRKRVVIENVTPSVDGGRFPAKRCAGDRVIVEADIFVDGHDVLRCVLMHRERGARRWNETEMTFVANDHWQAAFSVPRIGVYEYAITAWPDAFLTWRYDLARWTDPEDVLVSLQIGALLVGEAARRARGADGRSLRAWKARLDAPADVLTLRAEALDEGLAVLIARYADRSHAVTAEPPLAVTVDPPRAGFSAWYEMFPRSAGRGGVHGTFAGVEAMLPYVAGMGFDVLYLPPIHPIGITKRKGPNNAMAAAPGDPGSPWAIGGAAGGHKAIHPELGTEADFRKLVEAARDHGVEVALDIAFQSSPDHPYVTAHPEWFRHRPDGSIQYAENPPKKYQDIYPFNFDTEDWRALWQELLGVFLHWIALGVTIFRVDNPHTKPFAMWEWIIGEIKRKHPEVILLSEAFSRPRLMHRLAKVGFSQSYTYFTWRNTKAELTEYFTELSQDPSREYLRPNVWPNTPDILHASLQSGLRTAFSARLLLAGTLSANYGIYGPAFELMEHVPREPGSEEYRNSEKYEIRAWDRERADSLRPLIARLNAIRRANPALHRNERLRFHAIDNPQLICYSKSTDDFGNVILAVVNLDPRNRQSGWTDLALADLGLVDAEPDVGVHVDVTSIAFEVHDLLIDARYRWQGARNFVELRPAELPAHVFRVQAIAGIARPR
jgi:starch synthase (maltosyl-transferring)